MLLEARNLIIQACTLAETHSEQTKLLDLLEVFREFTEKGQIKSISSILASQVNNIEVATKVLETKTRAIKLTKPNAPIAPAIPASYAQTASLFVCLFIPFNVLCKSKTIVGRLGHEGLTLLTSLQSRF